MGYKILHFQDGNKECLWSAHSIVLPIVQNCFPSPLFSFSHMHPCNCLASKSSFHLLTLCPEPILFLLSVWFTWPKHSVLLFLVFRSKRSSLLILLLWHSPLRFLKRSGSLHWLSFICCAQIWQNLLTELGASENLGLAWICMGNVQKIWEISNLIQTSGH